LAHEENHLIELLPRRQRLQLLSICEPVRLVLSEVLCERGDPTTHVFFPNESFISLIAQVEQHPGVEVGMVGREGMLGAQLALGVITSPLHALVQGAGSAWRIETKAFRRELRQNLALQHVLQRYIFVGMTHLATSAVCLRYHLIGPRLARWLLMSQDRAHADTFHVTHEFLAYMLGVRRVGVTVAASAMQQDGLIEYHRGSLTVLDRQRLESTACSCYAKDQSTYAEYLH
jgi:CRP-like cAMP-binding protein